MPNFAFSNILANEDRALGHVSIRSRTCRRPLDVALSREMDFRNK